MAESVSGRVLKRAEKELAQSKVILRHLPPDYTEEKLKKLIVPFPNCTYFSFVSGNASLGKFGCSRAYLNFLQTDKIVEFRDKYDGMALESEKGTKYRLIIELAPFQGVPRTRSKPDHRCGTIKDDPEYKVFLENYEKTVDPLPSIDVTYLHEIEKMKVESIQLTPLTEYLRDRYSVPRAHRGGGGQRNKVLYAAGSRKKRDRGKESKSKRKETKEKTEKKRKGEAKEREGHGSGRDSSVGSKAMSGEKTSGTKAHNGFNGVQEMPTKEKVQKGKLTESAESPITKEKGSHRNKQRPDQQLFVAGGRRDSRKQSGEGEHLKNHEPESKHRGKGYPKHGKSYYNGRHDNHYEFKEEDDNYQGPDHRSSSKTYEGKSSRSREQENDREDKRGRSGRYYGRSKGYDRYGDGSRGGWDGGYRSHK